MWTEPAEEIVQNLVSPKVWFCPLLSDSYAKGEEQCLKWEPKLAELFPQAIPSNAKSHIHKIKTARKLKIHLLSPPLGDCRHARP
jgi:hypothetical protein